MGNKLKVLKFNEDTLSEKPAIDLLVKQLGYSYLSGDKLDPDQVENGERASRREVVLVGRLKRKLAEINPGLTEETIEKAVRRVTHIQAEGLMQANQAFHNDLVKGISLDQDIGARRQKVTVKFIDFENPEKNEFLVVNQFSIKGPKESCRPDIVVFINGIPFVVIECKSPIAKRTGVEEALKQLRRYQRDIPQLFHTNQILIGLNLFGAKYGTVGSEPEHFHEWKARNGEKLANMAEHPTIREMLELGLVKSSDLSQNPTAQDILLAGLFNKKNLLDIIQNFVVFEPKQGQIVKKICRYQQYTAVNKILHRVIHEKDKKGIIWHWQGSGKSLTMLWAALKLRRAEQALKNPLILIVTDRINLDEQISGTFRNCGYPNPIQIKKEGSGTHHQLYQVLSQGVGNTILTTIFLFRKKLERPITEDGNIIVLVDEAHRSQYGLYSLNLHLALPNAAFFAFTGTPIDKQTRNTFRHFSPAGEKYLDAYRIRQAEEDGAIVPVKYQSRLAKLQVAGNTLDSLFEAITEDLPDEEKAALKKKYSNLDTLAKTPRRIQLIAKDIVAHFYSTIRPNGFKAQLVAADRERAVLYKQELDGLIGEEKSQLVITINNDDPPEWKEKYRLTRQAEEQIVEDFKKPEGMEFLIVCDKLLTGFDAEIEQVMYLDQSLTEHTLLQAVARTNRPYPRKNFGLVVDYVGVGKELAQALKIFDQEDLAGLFKEEDFENELKALRENISQALEFFKDIVKQGRPAKDIIVDCVQLLKPTELRNEFENIFRKCSTSMDILLPDPLVAPFLDDFKFLGAIREGARNIYRDEQLDLSTCSKKVEALIHKHIRDLGVEEVLAPINITSPDFYKKMEIQPSEKAKASQIEYAIRDEIRHKVAEDPAFYTSLQEELDLLIEQQEQERREEAEVLRKMLELKEKAEKKNEYAKKLGLQDDISAAFFHQFQDYSEELFGGKDQERADFTKILLGKIKNHTQAPDWQNREDCLKDIRREIKGQLRSRYLAEDKVQKLTGEILELARVRLGQ